MRIFNEDKTIQLNESELDYSLGHLKDDKIAVLHHETTEAKPAKSVAEQVAELTAQGVEVKEINGESYRVAASFEGAGERLELIQDIPAEPAQEAYDEYEDIQVYVPYTAEELQSIAKSKRRAELKAELAGIKEDIEQENFGLVRDDFPEKKARAAEIINELRVLEGKEPREVRPSVL